MAVLLVIIVLGKDEDFFLLLLVFFNPVKFVWNKAYDLTIFLTASKHLSGFKTNNQWRLLLLKEFCKLQNPFQSPSPVWHHTFTLHVQMEVGKREIILYLSLHCHHQNDSCIKMGSDERHFNVSLIVREKSQDSVHKPQPFWRERWAEAVSNRGSSDYQPNRLAKPVHKTFLDLNRPNQLKISILSVWHWTSEAERDATKSRRWQSCCCFTICITLYHLLKTGYQVTEWIISEFEIEGMEYWNSRHGICIGFQP